MNELIIALIAAIAGGAGAFGIVQAITSISARARITAAIASLVAAREAASDDRARRTAQDAIDRQALSLSVRYLVPMRIGPLTLGLALIACATGVALPLIVTQVQDSIPGLSWVVASVTLGVIFPGVVFMAHTVNITEARKVLVDRQSKEVDEHTYVPPSNLDGERT